MRAKGKKMLGGLGVKHSNRRATIQKNKSSRILAIRKIHRGLSQLHENDHLSKGTHCERSIPTIMLGGKQGLHYENSISSYLPRTSGEFYSPPNLEAMGRRFFSAGKMKSAGNTLSMFMEIVKDGHGVFSRDGKQFDLAPLGYLA